MNSTLNHIFRVVWCKVRLTWIAVSEAVSGQGKVQSSSRRASRQTVGADTRRALLASAIMSASAVAAQPAPSALPTGGQVSAGQASIRQSAANMVIQQGSDRAAINWQSFNLGKDAQLQFQQPTVSSVILNRVMGSDPSQIFGRITANGQVILSNPSGIYFGASARVDVGALIATTHSMGDADFMAGKSRFERNGSTASVVNEGELAASLGGYIALLAPEVRNQGAIIAQMGTVALAAGEAVDLHFDNNNRLTSIRVEPSQIQTLVDNRLAVRAPGGLIVLSAQSMDRLLGGVVQNSGHIEASGLEQQGGRILLAASNTVRNSGLLNASSTQRDGGSISVLADHIELQDGARIDASGATGGGKVLVGGDWQGSNGVQQAITVSMASSASIDASALHEGDGGTVVLWSDVTQADSVTSAKGTILARGGLQGGDGGRIETSGHWLEVNGAVVNASASHGRSGEWLLDPQNVSITGSFDNNFATSDSGGTRTYLPNNDVSNINAGTIATALNGGTSVTVTTGTSGSQLGDLTVDTGISKSSGSSDVTLTLRAANSIVINRDILHTGGAGKLNLVIDADNNNPGWNGSTAPDRNGGGIVILEANLSTGGGSVTFGGTEVSGFNGGDLFVGGTSGITIGTSGGAVDVKGNLLIANSSSDGFSINTAGGGINLRRAVDSGNRYTAVAGQRTWQEAFNHAVTQGGWLATIGSSLENALAIRAASYSGAWLGGQRIIGTNLWQWTADPTYNATTNPLTFFYQGSTTQTQLGETASGFGGTTASGYFNNWNYWTNGSTAASEPNNWNGSAPGVFSQDNESVLQFTGSQGHWNDLARTALNGEVQRYVLETNLAPSRLNLNAGSGAVAIGAGVGFSKALSQLNVTAGSTTVAGGGIVTTGAQSYSSGLNVDNSGRVEISGTTVSTQGPVSVKSASNDVYLNAVFTNNAATSSTFNVEAARHIQLGSNASIASSTTAMATSLWADTDKSGDGIVYFEGSGIDTKGGALSFGKAGQTLGGSSVLVGGDVFFQRGSAQTLNTGGGALNIHGETIVANTTGLTINSSNGAVHLHGLLNSGNRYTWVSKVASAGGGSWDEARTEAKNGTSGGSATGDSYLVNITSRLENAISGLTAGYQGAWIGAYRPNTGNHNWAWADGPEAGQTFFTQNSTGGGGSTTAGYYANFGSGEPNGALSGSYIENVGQFFGSAGLWNDLPRTTTYASNSSGSAYAVKGYVRETNLAGSPVVIHAGSGIVQIQGGVGTAKALNSLDVTSSGTTVKGNGLITTGAQTYSSALTVNDSSYLQAVTLQAGSGGMTVGGAMTVYGGSFEAIQLNTDITSTASGDLKFLGTDSAGWSVRLGSGKAITKSAGTGTLTFAGPGRINNQGAVRATGTGVLNVVMSSETDNGSTYGVGTGTITSNGGHVWVGGGSLTHTWNGLNVGSRWASGTDTGGNANAIDITGNITTNGGDVLMAGWTAHPTASDMAAVGAPRTISTGSGDVTLLSRSSKFAASTTADKTTVSTTGSLTLAPLSGQGYTLVELTVAGTTASGHLTGAEDLNGLVVQNTSGLSGLTFGSYLGTGAAGDTAYSYQNNASTAVDTALSVNGPISLFGTDVNINQNLGTSTAGAAGDVLVKASANIVLASAKSITTNGGDVSLWANSDGQTDNGGVFLKSSSSVSTSGGHIWVGGGSGTTAWNGLTVGDGWAVSGRAIGDMGYSGGSGDWRSGVAMNQTTLSSGGGHIYIAGQRNASSPDLGAGFLNYSGTGTLIDAGAGTVTIKGSNTAAGSNIFGIMTGLHPGAYAGKFVVKSANATAANAIVLEGRSSAGTGDGILIENHTRLLSTAFSQGGGISVSGSTTGSRNALSVGVGSNPGTLEVLSASGKVDVNVGAQPLLIANSSDFRLGSVASDPDVASSTADVVITSSGVNWTGHVPVRTTGGLTIKPATGSSFTSTFNTQSLNYTGITALTIGHAQNTSGVTMGSATSIDGPISIHGGAISLASALTSNPAVTNSSIALNATGAVTQSAALTADSLTLNGSGHFTLTHTANSVGTVAAGSSTARIGSMQLVNAGALELGDATHGIWAVGDVKAETLSGDLTIGQNLNTLSATATAVVLNAGKSASAGTDTGGDVKLTGSTLPTITTGNGGRVTAFTGSLGGSTSLVGANGLALSGSGRFRYGSDETATHYTAALGSGAYLVYREQPSLLVSADSQTITYGDSPTLTTSRSGTGQNGDTLARAVPNLPTATVHDATNSDPTIAAGANGTNHHDAGTYTLRVGTMAASALGYALTTATGTLTVNKKAVTISADNAAKIYSLADPGLTVSYTGLVSGETSITDGTRAVTRAVGEAVGDYAINVTGAAATSNYALSYAPGTFTIAPVEKLLVTVGQTTAHYGTEAVYTASSAKYVSGTTEIALALADATGGGATDTLTFKDGANNTVTLKIDGLGTRNTSGFFNVGTRGLQAFDVVQGIAGITQPGATISGSLNVTPKLLSLSDTKVYDGSRIFSGFLTTGVGTETLSYTHAQANSANVGDATHFSAMTLANGANGGLASNYALPSLSAASANNAVSITARPLALVASKVYDGSTTLAASSISFDAIHGNANSGVVAGETLSVAAATGSSSHVADANKFINSITLADASGLVTNYSLPSLTATADNNLTITARALEISLTNTGVSKVYDGNADAAVANASAANTTFTPQFLVRNAVDGDTAALTYSAAYNSANVLSATALDLTSINLASIGTSSVGSQTTDYSWNDTTSVAASITARPVAVAGTGVSKVYDGSTSMTNVSVGFTPVAGLTESGVIAGQALTVSGGIGAFTSANAGLGVGYSLTSTADQPLVLTAGAGTLASNYSIPGGGAGTITGADGKIFQRPLSMAFTGDTKVYDGNTGATVTASFADAAFAPVAGDDLTINRSADYLTKDVGSAQGRVRVSGVSLSGSKAGNYTLTYDSTNLLHSPTVGMNAAYNTSAYGSITQRDSVTWVGASGGNWFDPGNWAVTGNSNLTNVVPDRANVAHVVIPSGMSVNFNSTATGLAVASEPVSLTSLQGSGATLNLSAGALSLGSGGSTLAGFAQTSGAVSGTGTFVVTDAFSQTGGTITTSGSGASVSIDQATGTLGWTSISAGGNLSVTSPGALSLGATTVGGDLTLNAGGKVTFGAVTVDGNLTSTTRGAGASGGVVQTGKVVIGGSASFIADSGTLQDAVLTDATNDFRGAVSFASTSGGSWRHVAVSDANSLSLGNISATGDLDARAGTHITMDGTVRADTLDLTATAGDITQNSGTLTVLTGPSNLTAGNDIRLDKANDFNGTVNASGRDIKLNDVNSLALGSINATGHLDATAGVGITLDATVRADTLDLTATAGDITQNSGTLTVLTGPSNLTAGNDIRLDKANDFNGTVNASGRDIKLNDVNGLALGDVTASGDLTLGGAGPMDLGTSKVGGQLRADSGGGNIRQRGPLQVEGPSSFFAGAGTVELTNAGNRLPKGARIQAARYAIAGDGNRMAQAAESQVQGSRNASSLRGTGVASATSPVALVTTSAPAAQPSDATVSSGGATDASVDLRSSAAPTLPSMMAVSMPRGTSTVGTGFSFELPQAIRDLAQGAAPVKAEMADGSPLPSWLRVDLVKLEVRATAVPFGGLPLQLVLTVAGQRTVVMVSERQE